MAYRLKASESVPEAVQRIAIEEIESAVDGLTKSDTDRDEAIHEARKSVKKIRGLLRLMRPELGETYEAENQRFRDVGHQLSEVRDAAALLETLDVIAEKYKNSLRKGALSGIRTGLEQAKSETEQAVNIGKVVNDAVRAFRAAAKNVKIWPLKNDGFRAIAPGLELTYRAGRKALQKVQEDPTPENYHYLRRRAKDHWYHVRLLESLWTEVQQAHESSLDTLQDWLGDEHNLVVLRQKIEADPAKFGGEEQVRFFDFLADQHQKELRENALSLAQRIYEQKRKQFTASMQRLWDAWQQQPAGISELQKQERQAAKKHPRMVHRSGSQNAVA
ncbi:MAG: CHAD domain-containing protein [Acidobacteriaceae bacterium]|nr:CHAD domain-containing protein [Acidobacteriaceae bacterium]